MEYMKHRIGEGRDVQQYLDRYLGALAVLKDTLAIQYDFDEAQADERVKSSPRSILWSLALRRQARFTRSRASRST